MAPEEQTTDSVFDFLYHDGRRIASLLSQFDPSGHLTQLSHGKSAERGKQSSSTADLTGNAGIAKYENKNAEAVTASSREDVLRVYDPTWTNARTLLDLLDERGAIRRDLLSAKIGQIVLVTGQIAFYDLELLSRMWGLPSVKKLMTKGVPDTPQLSSAQKRTAEGKRLSEAFAKLRADAQNNLALAQDMLPIMPHSVQLRVYSAGGDLTWGVLRREGMVMEGSDVVLKHGLSVPGVWSVLGILDAAPDDPSGNNRQQAPNGSEMLAKLYEAMAPAIRVMLGRPTEAFGITPLLVFREVTA